MEHPADHIALGLLALLNLSRPSGTGRARAATELAIRLSADTRHAQSEFATRLRRGFPADFDDLSSRAPGVEKHSNRAKGLSGFDSLFALLGAQGR